MDELVLRLEVPLAKSACSTRPACGNRARGIHATPSPVAPPPITRKSHGSSPNSISVDCLLAFHSPAVSSSGGSTSLRARLTIQPYASPCSTQSDGGVLALAIL